MTWLATLLALFWGIVWASFLQYNEYGHYLALRRTWIVVVVGVGVDLLIALFVAPLETWLIICAIIIASSLGVIARSLYNERLDEKAVEELANAR